jgi:hypothetical protein
MIYIREAHPRDGWWLGGGLPGLGLKMYGSKASTDIYDPTTLAERQEVAVQCVTALEYEIPTLVDGIDDPVNRAYAGLPTRLYLIDSEGIVAYAGGLGPFGFKPEELKGAIDELLAEEKLNNR